RSSTADQPASRTLPVPSRKPILILPARRTALSHRTVIRAARYDASTGGLDMSMLRTVGPSVPRSRGRLMAGPVVALVTALSIVAVGAVGAEAAPQAAAPVCATEALDETSASVMAKACGARVEVVAGRSELTQVFA